MILKNNEPKIEIIKTENKIIKDDQEFTKSHEDALRDQRYEFIFIT